MAKTRSLPDKYYDKDYEHNGIHRVPLWRIACFALNNTATNLYMMMMGYATYYLMGWVGVGMMMASSLSMIMRIWDGVTDPFVGFMVDKTNGKFGKNRPFIIIGNIILAVTSFILFHVTHQLPQAVRFPFYVVVLMIYYLGYTCQCVVTKSAQSCMTNDPKQRPMFASFDGVFNTVLFAGLAVVFANMANSYKDVGGYASTQFFHSLWVMTAIGSGIFTLLAVIAIAPKDRPEFFGTGKPVKVGLKDYWDTLKNNRAIQMLIQRCLRCNVRLHRRFYRSAGQRDRSDHHPQRHRHLPGHLSGGYQVRPAQGHDHRLRRRSGRQRSDHRPVAAGRPHHHDL